LADMQPFGRADEIPRCNDRQEGPRKFGVHG
jgi:hypothetical protein